MVHEKHWERLSSLAPVDVCRRSGARYDSTSGCYILRMLDRQVMLDPARRRVRLYKEGYQADSEPGYDAALAATVYLVEAKEVPPAGEWITAQSLPAGAFFFRGIHAVPTAELVRRFGSNRDLFTRAAEGLGGRSVEWGDAAVQLQVLPQIAIRIVLWLGDEEIPSQVTMLFDKLVHMHIPLDALQSLSRYTVSALLRVADESL